MLDFDEFEFGLNKFNLYNIIDNLVDERLTSPIKK